MKRIAYNPRAKKKGYFLGGGPMFEGGQFTDQGANMASLGANTLGTVGDVMGAQSGGTSIAGGALGGAAKGAKMGMALGPWGAAGGALIGGVAGAFNAKKLKEEKELKEEQALETSEQRATLDSQTVLSNYDNKGVNKGSSFAKGGMMYYPYQEQDEGNMIAPTIQLAQGGELEPISNTTVEVNGYNPNITDGVELENAYVDDGETIETMAEGGETEVERVYTDKFGINGKKASKKNPSFAKMHKKLQKYKDQDSRYEGFNTYMDKKSDDLFDAQESVKLNMGGKMSYQEGGKITDPIAKSDKTAAEWKEEMKRRESITPEEKAEQQAFVEAEADFIKFENQREKNPQFTDGIEPTPAKPSAGYKSAPIKNSWYADRMGDVDGQNLQEVYRKAAEKTGLSPTEFAAAMNQEGWNASSLNENLAQTGNIDSYGFGLDTVGNYSDVIEKKLGKDYSRDTLNLYKGENERKQAIQPANFKDIQRMADTAAAVYQHRTGAVDKTAKEMGVKLSPHEKQYFNYMAYNTQHNAPNAVVRGKEKSGEATNASLKMMMQDYKKKGKLGQSKEDFDSFVKVKGEGAVNPYGSSFEGKGQLFDNAGHAYRRIAELEGAYEQDVPYYLRPPEEETKKDTSPFVPELAKGGIYIKPSKKGTFTAAATKAGHGVQEHASAVLSNKESYSPAMVKKANFAKNAAKWKKEDGGYTDMNTLSAEHMKAGLSLKRKKKLQAGGIPEQISTGATKPLEQDLTNVLQGTGNYDAYNQSQIDLEQSQYPSLDETVAKQSQNLATGEATPDMSTQLLLGSAVTAPLTAGASLAKKALNMFKHSGQSTSTGSVGTDAAHLGQHTAESAVKNYAKGAIYNKNGGKISRADGGILGDLDYEDKARRFRIPPDEAEGLEIQNMGLKEPGNPVLAMSNKLAQNKNIPSTRERNPINLEGVADAVGMYGPNIAGMATRLPSPASPAMVTPTKLERMDNKEELDRINREYRGATKGLEGSAQEGAVEATKASMFAKKLQGMNLSNANLDKINTQIGNREAGINAQISATNARKEDMFNQALLSKDLKEREIRRDSLTNMADKFMASRSEDKMRELDKDKFSMMSKWYKDSGVSGRAFDTDLDTKFKKYGGLMRKKRKRALAA